MDLNQAVMRIRAIHEELGTMVNVAHCAESMADKPYLVQVLKRIKVDLETWTREVDAMAQVLEEGE